MTKRLVFNDRSGRVQLPVLVSVPSSAAFSLRFRVSYSEVSSETYGIWGQISERFILYSVSSFFFRLSGESRTVGFSEIIPNVPSFDSSQVHTYEIRKIPFEDGLRTKYRLYVDDVHCAELRSSYNSGGPVFSFDTICGAASGGFSGDFYWMELTVDGIVTNKWDAADPESTGSVLADTVGTLNGEIIGSNYEFNDGVSPEIVSSAATASPATTISYTVANLAGPVSQARLTRGTAVLTLTSVTETSAQVPALSDGLNIIPFGTGAQLELFDGTEWHAAPIEFTQPVGQGVVTLAGTLNTTETSYLFNYGGTPAVGDQFVNTNTDLTIAANGSITSDVDGTYTLYAIDVSDAQPALEAFTVTVGEAADTTAPTLTDATVSAIAQTTASATVTTDEGNGTLYRLISANASATVAAVKAGQSQPVTATGVQTVSLTGLTAETSYYVHFVQTDAAGNDSTVLTSSQFTTLAVPTVPVITVSGSATTTVAFGGTLPVFTASTNDGSPVVVSGDTPVNNLAGTYVIRFNSSNANGAATEVTRTVIVQAQVVDPVDPTLESTVKRRIVLSGNYKSATTNSPKMVYRGDRVRFVVNVTGNDGEPVTPESIVVVFQGAELDATDGDTYTTVTVEAGRHQVRVLARGAGQDQVTAGICDLVVLA
jgi:hypothetical protein